MSKDKDLEEIARRFRPARKIRREECAVYTECMRDAFIDLAINICENVNGSRERSLALTHLEEACEWAIKAKLQEEE